MTIRNHKLQIQIRMKINRFPQSRGVYIDFDFVALLRTALLVISSTWGIADNLWCLKKVLQGGSI
jgi:hypothetical protein